MIIDIHKLLIEKLAEKEIAKELASRNESPVRKSISLYSIVCYIRDNIFNKSQS